MIYARTPPWYFKYCDYPPSTISTKCRQPTIFTKKMSTLLPWLYRMQTLLKCKSFINLEDKLRGGHSCHATVQVDAGVNCVDRLKPNGQLDFSKPESVQQLTKSLLKRDFGLKISLPPDRLCPPVSSPPVYLSSHISHTVTGSQSTELHIMDSKSAWQHQW